MTRPRLGHPFPVQLPSGREVEVRAVLRRPPPEDLLEALAVSAVSVREAAREREGGREGSEIDPRGLALADANVLEAVLAALGAIAAPKVPLRCRNCGEHVEVDAAASLPIAPLLRPPGDPELDPPVDRQVWYELPRPIAVGRRGEVDRFRLGRRTLADRERLERLLGDDEDAPLPPLPPLVRALGLSALGASDRASDRASEGADGEPSVRAESPIAIARALDALDDEAFEEVWSAITRAWDEQHYPPRLLAPVACPACGARHDVEPVRRPLDWLPPRAPEAEEPQAFPELEEFRARAARFAREILREAALEDAPGLEIVVDDGVPPCDDGGEPLLGSYTPHLAADGDVRVQTSPFVIALYYRTFRSMWEDGPYDVDEEIRETIEHELEHHANFLSGDDPLDREEREAIAREHARLAGAPDAASQLSSGAQWLAGDFLGFLRATWPMWILVVFVLLLMFGVGR